MMNTCDLRTLCNGAGLSCRDNYGNYHSDNVLIELLQGNMQIGGGLNAKQAFDKYSVALTDRLRKDETYKGTVMIESLPDAFTDTRYKKYLEWMITSYLSGGIQHYEDIESKIYPALDRYISLLRKKILYTGIPGRPWSNETVITNFCGLHGCDTMHKGIKYVKPGLEYLLDKYPESEEIYRPSEESRFYKGKDINIYELHDEKEACYYGRGTKWCTAATNDNMFDSYYAQGDLYVVVPKKPSYKGERYQVLIKPGRKRFSYETPVIMNEQDSPVKAYDLLRMYPEIVNIPNYDADIVLYGTVIDKIGYYHIFKDNGKERAMTIVSHGPADPYDDRYTSYVIVERIDGIDQTIIVGYHESDIDDIMYTTNVVKGSPTDAIRAAVTLLNKNSDDFPKELLYDILYMQYMRNPKIFFQTVPINIIQETYDNYNLFRMWLPRGRDKIPYDILAGLDIA